MEKSLKEFQKQIDELLYLQCTKMYNYIKRERIINEGIFTRSPLEEKKSILDGLISYFKEIGHDDKVKYLEEEMMFLIGGGDGR